MQTGETIEQQRALSNGMIDHALRVFSSFVLLLLLPLPLFSSAAIEFKLPLIGILTALCVGMLVAIKFKIFTRFGDKAWFGFYLPLLALYGISASQQGIYTFGAGVTTVVLATLIPNRRFALAAVLVTLALFANGLWLNRDELPPAYAARSLVTVGVLGLFVYLLSNTYVHFETVRLRLTQAIFVVWLIAASGFGLLERNPWVLPVLVPVAIVVGLLFARGRLPRSVALLASVLLLAPVTQAVAVGVPLILSLPILMLVFYLILPAFRALVFCGAAMSLYLVLVVGQSTALDTDLLIRGSLGTAFVLLVLYRLFSLREERVESLRLEDWFSTNQRSITLTLVASILVVLVAAGTAYRSEQRLFQLIALHDDVDRLNDLLIDRETGFRGYILSGQTQFLEPFFEAGEQLSPLLQQIDRSLLNLNFDSAANWLQAVRGDIERREEFYTGVLDIFDRGEEARAVEMFESGAGKQITDRLRAEAESLQLQISSNRPALHRQSQVALLALPLVSLLSFVLLFMLYRQQSLTLRHGVTEPLQSLTLGLTEFANNNKTVLSITGDELLDVAKLQQTGQWLVDSVRSRNQALMEKDRVLEQKNASLAAELDKFDAVCDLLELAYWRLDLTTQAITYNRRFAQRWALDPEGSISFDALRELQGESRFKSHAESIDRVIETGEKVETRFEVKQSSGTGKWFELNYWPEFNAEAEIVAIRVSNLEITSVVENEQTLLRQNAELDSTQKELRQANNELELKAERQRELFAIIGHELRTPLASMLMLEEEQGLESVEPYGASIVEQTRSLLAVLEDMRTVVQPDRVKTSTVIVDSPARVVERAVSAIQGLLLQHGKTAHISIEQCATLNCHFNAQALRQLITILTKNAAIHASGDGIWISIECEAQTRSKVRLRFAVDDNGQGISKVHQAKLFEAFERGDTNADGTGLGLFITKELVGLLNGSIRYADSLRGGARFEGIIELDLAIGDAPKPKLNDVAALKATLAGKRVLFAEDQLTLRMLSEKLLEKAGAEVVGVENGQLALQHLAEGYDIIITDVMMPVLDGYGFTRQAREQGFTGPIVGVTAAVVGEESERLVAAGADAVLPKPLNINDLRRTLLEIRTSASET